MYWKNAPINHAALELEQACGLIANTGLTPGNIDFAGSFYAFPWYLSEWFLLKYQVSLHPGCCNIRRSR